MKDREAGVGSSPVTDGPRTDGPVGAGEPGPPAPTGEPQADTPPEKELLCTLCGLRACWT